ncbi:MAG: hypothetical protein V4649_12620 [Bacteroidota bacterium]
MSILSVIDEKSFRHYEHRTQPLAPMPVFYGRIMRNLSLAAGILSCCLAIGVAGYHYFAGIVWIDAFHNASMILSGMGPVVEIKNTGGKIFSSLYALFSGVAFITNIGFIFTPLAHRLLHKLHLDDAEGAE